jgi:hypothetical protein
VVVTGDFSATIENTSFKNTLGINGGDVLNRNGNNLLGILS